MKTAFFSNELIKKLRQIAEKPEAMTFEELLETIGTYFGDVPFVPEAMTQRVWDFLFFTLLSHREYLQIKVHHALIASPQPLPFEEIITESWRIELLLRLEREIKTVYWASFKDHKEGV